MIKARGHEAEVKSQKAWDGRLETEVERHESEVKGLETEGRLNFFF